MALLCCCYLASWSILEERESDSFRDVLKSGYFGFLDYTSAHYFSHVQESKPLFESKVLLNLLHFHRLELPDQPSYSA